MMVASWSGAIAATASLYRRASPSSRISRWWPRARTAAHVISRPVGGASAGASMTISARRSGSSDHTARTFAACVSSAATTTVAAASARMYLTCAAGRVG